MRAKYLREKKLTESSLLDLECGECEDSEQLDHDLDKDLLHGRRNLSENPQTAEVVLQTLKEIYECVITRANSLSCLMDTGVTNAIESSRKMRYAQREGYRCRLRLCLQVEMPGKRMGIRSQVISIIFGI